MNQRDRDKKLVYLKCDGCNADISIKYGTYRRTKNNPHYCRKCRGINEHNRIESLPINEKKAYKSRKNKAIAKGWSNQSDEMKKHVSDMRKEESARPERKALKKKLAQERWDNKSEEEKINHMQKMHKGRDDYYGDPENMKIHSDRGRDNWYKQSIEEQNRILNALEIGRINYLAFIPIDIRESKRKNMSVRSTSFWKNLSFEEKIIQVRKAQEGKVKSKNIKFTNTEKEFINILNLNNIEYEYQFLTDDIHPEFFNLFPNNPVNGDSFVSPFHAWDFRLNLKQKQILIDIDGSIHDPFKTNYIISDNDNSRYNLKEFNHFYDTKRIYQTDNLEAYVIKAYDDKLGDNIKVMNVQYRVEMTFKDFILYLNGLNMNDKDIKEMIKLNK